MRQPGEDPIKVPGGGWTNRWNIPEPMTSALKAFERGQPQLGRISCTELLDPPRKRELIRRHWDDADFTLDVGDYIQAFIGGAVHAFIEAFIKRREKEGVQNAFLVEESLTMAMKGWTITGRPDLYFLSPLVDLDEAEHSVITKGRDYPDGVGIIDDHKTTAAYKIQKGAKAGFHDWGNQLDIYAVLYRHHGMPVHLGRNLWYLKDWKLGLVNTALYPTSPAGKIIQHLRSEDDAHRFLEERVALHLHYARAMGPDKDLPECTAEERWEKNPSFAVWKMNEKTKEKNKRPSKVFTVNDGVDPAAVVAEARTWIGEQKKPQLFIEIETRKGESTRCQRRWCSAWQVCPIGQKIGPNPEDTLEATPETLVQE